MRTDEHRPSAINPEDYEYVAIEIRRIEHMDDVACVEAERAVIKAHMARTGGTYSGHEHGGNCHVCGAHAIYTVLFWHRPTNTYIRTGGDCAEKLDEGRAEYFRSAIGMVRKGLLEARELKAGKMKAEALLAEHGLEAAWALASAPRAEDERREEETVRDIVAKLIRYGDLSDAQIGLLHRLVERIANRARIEAERAAEHEAAAPVPTVEGRVTVQGEVLTKRYDETMRGTVVCKVLLRHPDGYRLWGTLPEALEAEVERGDRIELQARVTASEKDPKFGFFSRPTKARKLETEPAP